MKRNAIIALILTFLLVSCHQQPVADEATRKLINQGNELFYKGQLLEALNCFARGMEMSKNSRDSYYYYLCLGNIGNVYTQKGDLDRAIFFYQKAYQAAREKGDNNVQYGIACNLVGVYGQKDNKAMAERMYKLQQSLSAPDPENSQVYLLQSEGLVAGAGHNYPEAVDKLKKAIQLINARHLDYAYAIDNRCEIGNIFLKWNKPDSAISNFEQCYNEAARANYEVVLPSIFKGMSKAWTMKGDSLRARIFYMRYLDFKEKVIDNEKFDAAENKIISIENEKNAIQIDHLTYRSKMQTLIIALVAAMVILMTVLFLVVRHNNKRLRYVQQLLVEKNERLRHDSEQQKKLLDQYAEAVSDEPTEMDDDNKSERKLSEAQLTLLLRKIENVMSDMSTISDSEFSLKQMADAVESNTKYVSVAINEAYGMNFKSLLNEHRIREACRRFTDPNYYNKMTLSAIGRELGFNSYSAFIAAFKKVTGMTPSVYQRLALKSKSSEVAID